MGLREVYTRLKVPVKAASAMIQGLVERSQSLQTIDLALVKNLKRTE
jgi:hypothetical protein